MSQPASQAQAAAFGAVISIGGVTGASGSETFNPIGSITDAKFGGYKVTSIDVSTFSSNKKRKLAGLIDAGTVTLTTLRVSNDTGQAAVIAACSSGLLYDFKIQLIPNAAAGQVGTPDSSPPIAAVGDLYTFSAIVTEAGGFDLSLTKSPDYTFTLDIDGDYTLVEGS